MANKVSIQDRTAKALEKVGQLTDKGVQGFTEDSVKLARALLGDLVYGDEKTGKLQSSIKAVKVSYMVHAIQTDAKNQDGYGYGAAQEYGWHPQGKGEKRKGRFFIIRGTAGMIGKWKRGERWKD